MKTIKYPVLDRTLCSQLHAVYEKWNGNLAFTVNCIKEVIQIVVDFEESIRSEGFIFYNKTFDFLNPSFQKIDTFCNETEFEFENGTKVSEAASCMELTGLEHRQVAELFQRCYGNLYVYKDHYVTVDYDEYYNDMEERVVGYPKLIFNRKVIVEDDSLNDLALDENGKSL
jgi:hypothetical protein